MKKSYLFQKLTLFQDDIYDKENVDINKKDILNRTKVLYKLIDKEYLRDINNLETLLENIYDLFKVLEVNSIVEHILQMSNKNDVYTTYSHHMFLQELIDCLALEKEFYPIRFKYLLEEDSTEVYNSLICIKIPKKFNKDKYFVIVDEIFYLINKLEPSELITTIEILLTTPLQLH